MERSQIRYRTKVYVVSDRADTLAFQPGHPLSDIRQRLDVVQATQPFPAWCSDMWQDVFLPVYLIRFLLEHFGEEGLLIELDSGATYSKLGDYEDKLEACISKAEGSNAAAYDKLLSQTEIVHARLGADVEVFVYPTYAQAPYSDALLYAIRVKGFAEEEYHAMAEKLAEVLSACYDVKNMRGLKSRNSGAFPG